MKTQSRGLQSVNQFIENSDVHVFAEGYTVNHLVVEVQDLLQLLASGRGLGLRLTLCLLHQAAFSSQEWLLSVALPLLAQPGGLVCSVIGGRRDGLTNLTEWLCTVRLEGGAGCCARQGFKCGQELVWTTSFSSCFLLNNYSVAIASCGSHASWMQSNHSDGTQLMHSASGFMTVNHALVVRRFTVTNPLHSNT